MTMKSREQIYRIMYSNTDRFGAIQKSQGEMADLIEVCYQQMSNIYKEFVDMGMLRKDKHKFTVLYHPDKIPWGPKFDSLRAKYSDYTRSLDV